jgi:hypothetical protein
MEINLRWFGYDKERKKIIWDVWVFYLALILVLDLGYNAYFIQPFTMDNWGTNSIYITKTMIIMGLSFGVWAYLVLNRRIKELENGNTNRS